MFFLLLLFFFRNSSWERPQQWLLRVRVAMHEARFAKGVPYLLDQTLRYYLFHRANLCGFYSRAATNREQRLLNSVFSVKFFVIARALRKASFIRRIAMQLDQPPLCYKAVPTRHFQSVSSFSSNDFTRWSPSVPQKMPNSSGHRAFLYLLCTHLIFEPKVCSRAHVLLEY